MSREMKNSGVDWIGNIPMHWNIKKPRFIFSLRNSKGNKEAVLLAATQKYGMYPQDLLEGVVKVNIDTDLQSFKTVHKNDYVISLRSFQGGFEMSDYEGVCTPAYQVFYAKEPVNYRYYKYLFKTDDFISKLNSFTIGIREGKNIQFNDFAKLTCIPVPPTVSEQTLIADYLDQKCAEIDKLISVQERMIEKLTTYKQSVITEAVTKGLNPNVKMKDSGVKWIGKTPEHWDLKRFKYILKLVNIPSFSDKKIGLENIESGTGKFIPSNSLFDGNGIQFLLGNIVYGKLRPYLQKVWLAEFEGNAVGDFFVFSINDNNNSNYIKWLMLSDCFTEIVNSSTYGAKMPRVASDFILNLSCYIPSKEEQSRITDYLNKKTSEIDRMIEIKKEKIEKLNTYKKSIIFEYVTGKKEVPHA